MPNATPIIAEVYKDGSALVLARVVAWDAALVTQGILASISYTIYEIDPNDPDGETAVTGHSAAALVVNSTVFDSLQTDAVWTVDATGYNFKHQINASSKSPFPKAGKRYAYRATLVPSSGQAIEIAADLHCVR